MTGRTLTDADVDAIARRVAELLSEHRTPTSATLVDAATLAEILSVTRSYVYEHANELGAVRLGNGPRARLRFDVDTARAARRTPTVAQATTEPQRPTSRRRRQTTATAGAVLRVGGRKRAA